MNFILCLVVFGLGYISAQPPQPHECCTPEQFEGYTDGVTGYVEGENIPIVFWAQQRFHIDHTTRRTAVFIELFEENTKNWRHIEIVTNHDERRRYLVEEGACKIENVTTEMMPTCLHIDSEHDHEFYIGGVNGLMVDSWRVPSSDTVSNRHVRTIRAPPGHCLPYQYTGLHIASSSTERSFADMVSYNRITEGIVDTSVFEVPSECHHAKYIDFPPVVKAILKAYEK